MSKIKILYLITKGDTGGAQKYVRDLATHLDPARFETKILYGGKDLKWLSNRVRPWFLFLNDVFAIFEMVRMFKRERPTIVHLNSSKAGVLGALAVSIYKLLFRFQLPITNPSERKFIRADYQLPRIIFTAHGWVFNPFNHISAPVRFFYILLHRFAAWFIDIIINVSEYDRHLALCSSIAPPRKLVTIHNGIDPNIPFLSKEEARKEILHRLSITNYSPYGRFPVGRQLPITANWVGSLGRLVKEKNYTTLVEAARLVPNAQFFIIGDGYEKQHLQLLITDYQLQHRFHIVSSMENDVLLLKALDIFVLPSVKEGLPYSLLEAMAAGIPAVVTNVGGMPEVARHCQNISMVPPRNPTALASEIKNALGRKTETTSCVPFSLQAMITETEGVYTGIEK